MTDWQAQWIWPRGAAWTVNFHGFARREFTVNGKVRSAVLRLSAFTDYVVWVNSSRSVNSGLVGRGPEPNDPWFQTYDTYDVTAHLQPGANVVAILVHNYAVGTHWQHRGQGGLIAQIDIETANGTASEPQTQTVATDATWKVTPAACYVPNTPRVWWPAGFLETFDFRQFDPNWVAPNFDDSGWDTPDVLGPVGTKPWTRLIARDIPLLRETRQTFAGGEKGTFALPPVQCIGFDTLLPPGQTGLVQAQATFTLASAQNAILHIECDDAFKLWVNGAQAAEQNYSEEFARTRVWRGKDEYDQIHDGMGHQEYEVPVGLNAGENRLVVVVDVGTRGWGFLLALRDAQSQTVLETETPLAWTLTPAGESSGLWDSLDNASDAPPAGVPTQSVQSRPTSGVTDYATLMRYETRSETEPVDINDNITLRPGEFCILDLGRVDVGYPELTLTAPDNSVVDIGFSQTLSSDKRIHFSNLERMKCVDRLFLAVGTQTWQPALRRNFRYMHLSCREGEAVTVQNASLFAVGYPVEDIGHFTCADETLNRIYAVSVYTTKILMQQGWQDCLRREQGTLNTSSFNYGGRGSACAFGDARLTKKNLRQAIRTQQDNGWFDSHGISSPNSDEVTECLWWAVWLKDYYQYSGDEAFVREVFDNLEDNLRFFSKGINRHGLIEGRNRPIAWRGQGIYLDDSLNSGPYTGLFEGELSGFNMLFCAALEAASYLAGEVGQPERAAYHQAKADRVRRALNERLWDTDRQLYRDWRRGDELAATYHPIPQITALYFQTGNKEQTDALLRWLCDDLGLPTEDKSDYPLFTFGYYYYFLENLFLQGRDALAYELLRGYYGRWLELGATTFGEFFQPARFQGQTTLTEEYEVHAYGTSAHLHFYSNILGVQPLEPGFHRVRIAPHPGDLQWARGALATPQGKIEVDWRQETDTFALKVTLPSHSTYEVQWPRRADGQPFAQHRLTVNGQAVNA